jgi:TRAP-type mannitol/chloroaromatic compound transport system permease large subunit
MIEAQNGLGLLRPNEYNPFAVEQILRFGAMLAAGLAGTWFLFGRAIAIQTWAMSKGLIAPLLVVFVVLGSIYGGITGITEAAGMGSVAVLILIWLRGEFTITLVREALMRTFRSTGTIIWVTFGATALAGAYTIAGGPTYVANLIVGSELPTLGILLVMMVIFLFLGAFMDWVGIVLLVMPVFLPIVLKLPVGDLGLLGPLASDPRFVSVWFGILFCVNMQVSFLSPPFGPAAFYLKSVAPPHISLPDIFRGFLPFIGIQIVVLTLILFFPELTMFFRS